MNILERVSEQDVHDWLKARLSQIRADHIPGCHYLDLNASIIHKGEGPQVFCGIQSDGECVVCEKDSTVGLKNLMDLVHGDPEKRAKEKRAEAEALLAQVEELEKLAASIRKPIVAIP